MHELIEQIAIRRMKLGAVEAGSSGVHGPGPKTLDDAGNFLRLQRARHGVGTFRTDAPDVAFRRNRTRVSSERDSLLQTGSTERV